MKKTDLITFLSPTEVKPAGCKKPEITLPIGYNVYPHKKSSDLDHFKISSLGFPQPFKIFRTKIHILQQ